MRIILGGARKLNYPALQAKIELYCRTKKNLQP